MNTEIVPTGAEQLSVLADKITKKYKELVVEGPLSAYFSVVEGGFFDAAQMLTPQIKAGIANFQSILLEEVMGSDYFRVASKALEDIRVATETLNVAMSLLSAPEEESSVEDAAITGTEGPSTST